MEFSINSPQVIVWLVPIPVSSCADGPSPCCVVVEVATSTRSTALRAIAVWRPHLAWLVLTSVCSAGGQCYIVTVERKFLEGRFREGELREIMEK